MTEKIRFGILRFRPTHDKNGVCSITDVTEVREKMPDLYVSSHLEAIGLAQYLNGIVIDYENKIELLTKIKEGLASQNAKLRKQLKEHGIDVEY
jgi:hypothetical protein